MIFLDTSVMVAATSRKHPKRDRSIDRMVWAVERGAACAAHSLAELYSTLSGMPAPQRMSTIEALTVLETIENTFQIVSLNSVEYIDTVRDLSARNLSGGIVYDALLIACARKIQADQIFTLNLKHFHRIAPDLSDRIFAP